MLIRTKKGFTLIEMIIYLAILSVMVAGVLNLNVLLQQSRAKFTANRRVHQDVNTFFNSVDFLVKNSSGWVTDSTGRECQDFEGSQGPSSYYMSLYFNTSSAATALPYECRGDYNATTTAVKIYWRGSGYRGLWIDCFRGFINGNSSNCTTIQNGGDSSFMMTSDKNSVIYDGGLVLATSTAYGNPALKIQLTMGIPATHGLSYAGATTTASTTAVFRLKVTNAPQPTEVVCGDSSRGSGEVCDSSLTSACSLNGNYYKGNYSEDSSTCSGKAACNASCSACISSASCDGASCGGYSSGGKCWYLGTLGQSCNTVCTGHGSCVSGNSYDDSSCTILTALGADCSGGCDIGGVRFVPYWDGANYCQYSSTLGETCASSNAGARRLCACSS